MAVSAWVVTVLHDLCFAESLQLQKFLETHKRGALFVNADYAAPESPREPAFDWVTIDQLGDTFDKILQESVALYDPAKQVIVFIFLLSKSGNSMAIWRRKIPVPEILQTGYQDPIAETKAGLQRDYPVYVEESVVDSSLRSYATHSSLSDYRKTHHQKSNLGIQDLHLVGS